MKKYTLILFFIYPFLSISQDLPQVDGKVVYNFQTDKTSLEKEILYKLCEDFLSKVIKKENVVIHVNDFVKGQIIARGISAFSKFAKKGWSWTIGVATRPQFTMQFDVSDGYVSLTIKDILLSALNVNEEVFISIEDDMIKEKRIIQSLKGKTQQKRITKYQKNADIINDHFYSILVLFKRELDKL